ncbi:MAG TPA: class I SAM-dependent methyltransferase [Dehalococcoidia bacterium]|nr:class I SAM-dependent methyltransferase [Dehalococcoidia bacterium]
MVSKAEQMEEEILGIDSARKYAEGHKKYAKLMFRGVLNDIKANNISGSCLEAGAGPGLLAIMITQQNPEINITAIDISPDMATIASEYISQNKLENRIRYLVGDVGDEGMLQELGKFNFVYSTYSLHHWETPENSIRNLWNAVEDNGVLYIYDFKRIGWLCSLPLKGGEIDSMRAAYTPAEIKDIFHRIGITNYRIKTPFPFLFQSIIAWKKLV